MALKLAVTYRGLSAPDAYHRVTSCVLDFRSETGSVGISVYADAAAREAGAEPLYIVSEPLAAEVVAILATQDQRAAAYTYLKALPAYEGAEDV